MHQLIWLYTKLSGLSNDGSYYLNLLEHVLFCGKYDDTLTPTENVHYSAMIYSVSYRGRSYIQPGHLSKSVFVHRRVRFMNGDKQCVGFIPDIYKLLDKYQVVGNILTFLNDALFPSKFVWRAILRQHVL